MCRDGGAAHEMRLREEGRNQLYSMLVRGVDFIPSALWGGVTEGVKVGELSDLI